MDDLVEGIQQTESLEYNGIKFTDFNLKIVLPKNLKGNMKERATHFYKRHKFTKNIMQTRYQDHTAWFELDPINFPRAIMYDMPSSLSGIADVIEMMLEKGFMGRPAIQEANEQRELGNFKRVMEMLIGNSNFASDWVEVIDEF